MSSTAGDTTTQEAPKAGPVGGPITKKQRKEQFETLGALQTQLDVSVSLARNKVASWLNVDAFSDEEDSSSSSTGGFAAATVVKPRQPGLGLGAKFISHKDQMRHVPMNAFESKLKRQLTGGIVNAEIQRAEAADKNALPDKYMEHKMMMAARRKELQEHAEDEEDSRTRNIGAGTKGSVASTTGGTSTTATVTVATKKPKGTVETKTGSSQPEQMKKKNQGMKYQAAIHPAVLKAAASSEPLALESTNSGSNSSLKPAVGSGKKRQADFFSMYMDERASKMAKKKKKSQAKADPDDDN